MTIILSPSKSMETDPLPQAGTAQPDFRDRSSILISKLRKFSVADLMDFMKISQPLAELNRQRFKDWKTPFAPDNARPALFAFTGDVYDGLSASTLKRGDIAFAQKHLRILSGLYGLLRPLDLIQPYRLEMGRPLKTENAANLYEFWRETVTAALSQTPGDLLVNLASQEYAKVIDRKKLNKQIVSPIFKDEKNGRLKIISFYAKKARGAMARYLIQNRVADIDGLPGFAEDGYRYHPDLSTPEAPVFTRPER
ncbi:MAG: peroxide stress protein YaaA [Kiritimatiellales bacterium]